MERRGSNNWLIAVLAIALGFLIAYLVFHKSSNSSSSTTVSSGTTTTTSGTNTAPTTTSTTTTGAAPENPQPTVQSCVNLWNQQLNRGDQTVLVNIMAHQPVRVHVGETSDVPPKCMITVIGNNGDAWVFPAAGGSTYPYAQAPSQTTAKALPAAQTTANALAQRDGTLAAR